MSNKPNVKIPGPSLTPMDPGQGGGQQNQPPLQPAPSSAALLEDDPAPKVVAVEEPAPQPAQQPAQPVAPQPAAQKPAPRPAQKPVPQPAQQPVQRPAQQPAQPVAPQPAPQPVDYSDEDNRKTLIFFIFAVVSAAMCFVPVMSVSSIVFGILCINVFKNRQALRTCNPFTTFKKIGFPVAIVDIALGGVMTLIYFITFIAGLAGQA